MESKQDVNQDSKHELESNVSKESKKPKEHFVKVKLLVPHKSSPHFKMINFAYFAVLGVSACVIIFRFPFYDKEFSEFDEHQRRPVQFYIFSIITLVFIGLGFYGGISHNFRQLVIYAVDFVTVSVIIDLLDLQYFRWYISLVYLALGIISFLFIFVIYLQRYAPQQPPQPYFVQKVVSQFAKAASKEFRIKSKKSLDSTSKQSVITPPSDLSN